MTPQEMVELALSARTTDGCVVMVTHESRVDLRWARSTLTTNGSATSLRITVIAFHRSGSGTSTATVARSASQETIAETVREAEAAARAAEPADDAMPLIDSRAATADWDRAGDALEASALAEVALALGEVLRGDIEHFGYAEQSLTTTWLGTSTGLRLRFSQPAGRLEMTAKSHGRSRSAWAGAAAADLSTAVRRGEVDIAGMDGRLRQGLDWQAHRINVEPGRTTAILTPGCVGDLMVDLWWSSAGRDAAEGRSVFSRTGGGTRLGERLSAHPLRLFSDADYPGMACAPFLTAGMSSAHASVFDNGLPLGRTSYIDDGRLSGLVTTRASAAEFNLPLTTGPDNLIMESPTADKAFEELVATCPDGLLVTCLWYIRVVDPQSLLVTGLTRDGVYVVKGGEVIGAAGNFRFNESPVGMLDRVREVSTTSRTLPREMADYVNRVAMPGMVVDAFNFSTPSDAL